MWRQLIDHDEAWPESSSSAMFTFALSLDSPLEGRRLRFSLYPQRGRHLSDAAIKHDKRSFKVVG
jgi:rhamnogalacturonyl hydrolase YesR